MISRRLIACLLALAACSAVRGGEFLAGADISSLPVFEGRNARYYDQGVQRDLIPMFRDHGVNWFRLRLFVNPQAKNNYNGQADPFVVQDLNYTIALAQRVKLAGGKVLLDFHYSDTWADPGHQWKPAAWRTLNATQLTQQVYDYTRTTIESFKTAGALPEMVQIGNEIASGLLWNGEYVTNVNNTTVGGANTGYPWTGGNNSTGFDRLAALLSAGVKGARDGTGPGQEPQVMIHHDQGSNWGTTSYYFDGLLPRMRANGADIDVIGYSYYPLYHSGGIPALQQNLNNTASRYNKPVVVVEAGYPSRNAESDELNKGWPVTAAGQKAYLEDVIDAVQAVPNDMGRGVFWWFADARPASGLSVWKGGRYGLFDQSGNLLPAIDAYAGLNPVPGDYNGDNKVNGADLAAWSDGFGQSGPNLPADGDRDGDVDGADFLFWQQRVTAAAAAPATAPTPEPGGACLAAIGVLVALGPRRRRVGITLPPTAC